MMTSTGEQEALLPPPVPASPKASGRETGYYSLSDRSSTVPHAASSVQRTTLVRHVVLLGALLITGMYFFYPSHTSSVDIDVPRAAPPPVPAGEGTVLATARWDTVQPYCGPDHEHGGDHDDGPRHRFKRQTELLLDPKSKFFLHSFGARHTAVLTLDESSRVGAGFTLASSGQIHVAVTAYADSEWVLNNELQIVTLSSKNDSHASGVGIFSSHHPFHNRQHTIDVHLTAHLPDVGKDLAPAPDDREDASSVITRIEVRADAGSFRATNVDLDLEALNVNIRVGAISLDGTIPRTEQLNLFTDAGNIRVAGAVESGTVHASTRTGALHFGAGVTATGQAVFIAKAGTVAFGGETGLQAPFATVRTDSGSIHLPLVWTDELAVHTGAGSISVDEAHARMSATITSGAGSVYIGSVHTPKLAVTSHMGSIDARSVVAQSAKLHSAQGKVTVGALAPVVFTATDSEQPADIKANYGDEEDEATVSITSSAGSVTARFTDVYSAEEGDPSTMLAHRVESTVTTQAGSASVAFSPSFAGTVAANAEVGKVHLAWAGPHPARQWEWSHSSHMIGEEYEGCVFPVGAESVTADAAAALRGKLSTDALPARCGDEHVPAHAAVSSHLGSIKLSF